VDPGDLGRRITARSEQLGLTRRELARQAGVDPVYLKYLEESPEPAVGTATILKLAAALDTTPSVLLGGGLDRPPGADAKGPPPMFEPLDDDECRRLLAPGGVGRLVFDDADGPVALPVNFTIVQDDIVFRAVVGSVLERAGDSTDTVGFEVDRIDDAQRAGWSVLARGEVRNVADPAELDAIEQSGLESWRGTGPEITFRLVVHHLSGRRLRADR
jgi:transcriptional regulator with XRE-family HTH domain